MNSLKFHLDLAIIVSSLSSLTIPRKDRFEDAFSVESNFVDLSESNAELIESL